MERTHGRNTVGWTSRLARLAAGLALVLGATSLPAEAAGASATNALRFAPPVSSRLAGGSCAVASPSRASALPAGFAAAAVGRATNGGGLQVTCALPSRRPGEAELEALNPLDCAEWYTVSYQVSGASRSAKVTAEAIGYDLNGIVINSLPVKQGDPLLLKSVNPSPNGSGRSEIKTQKRKRGVMHRVVAPVPVLKVTVEDNGETATAYCSNVSWFEVITPQNAVVTDEDGANTTEVVVAAPRVDPATLSLKVDGIDIFDAPTAPNPGACTADAPCAPFTVDINGSVVTVSNLVVDIASYYEQFASNTVRFSLENQACGGHVYVLDGERNPAPIKPRYATVQNRCFRDDVFDVAQSSIFGVRLTRPFDGSRLPAATLNVQGIACGGREITRITLNGKEQNLAAQTCVLGDGLTTADTCQLPFSDALTQTNIEADLTNGLLQVGTLDLGSNRIVAAATDDLGNRAFDRITVVTGATAAPGIEIQNLLSASASDMAVGEGLKDAIMPDVLEAMNTTAVDIENAFVVGISRDAVQRVFTQLCTAPGPALLPNGQPNPNAGKTPGQIFSEKVKAAIGTGVKTTTRVEPTCSCDLDVPIRVDRIDVGTNVSCPVTLTDNKISVQVNLPNVVVHGSARASCEDTFLGACVARTVVNVGSTATVTGIRLNFDVTENNILTKTASNPVGFFQANPVIATSGGIDIQCLGGDICDALLTVVTLGQIDFTPSINISNDLNFRTAIGASKPDPVQLNEIKIDEQVVANFDQKLSGKLSSVEIDATGIRAGLKGSFTTTAVDSEIDPTLGGVLTPNSALPTFAQIGGAKDVFIGLSDDTINMLFASMTAAGKLKGECSDTGRTVGSLLDLNKDTTTNAADCDSITVDTGKPVQDALATAGARGLCYGIINANCDSINLNPGNPNDLNTATAQGVCHATRGDDCNHLSLAAGPVAAFTEKQVCTVTPNQNIHADQKLLFCARQELPPRMLFTDNTATPNAVESTLRMNDLSVVLVLDRNNGSNTGTPDGAINTALGDVPGCFTQGTATNADCNLFATCLDLSVDFSVEKATTQCPAGKPGFVNRFTKLEFQQDGERGYICGAGGTTAGTDSAVVGASQTDQAVTIDLTAAAQNAAPPICGAGLNLGLFGACGDASIFAADVAPSGLLKDFIGLTCKLQ